ncbi:MAG TPA: tetratricopeptide repeat protein [Myxococcota bacterium]|nr:tetratricopeptide repeat protein [Myxococcota bacterium]
MAETGAWRGSDHERAMQPADASTVLGAFDDARFEKDGVTTTFSRRDGRLVVRTDGPDGALQDYDVAYTFGVEPLQQLLLPLPGGRLQALGVAWDSRPREAGGQRWFSLTPHEHVPPSDVLHWTRLPQTWNSQCAECHSTDLRKGYDPARDAYDTKWSDVDVACEVCHGPGSAHVAWGERAKGAAAPGGERAKGTPKPADAGAPGLAVHFEPRATDRWTFAPGAAIAHRATPAGDAELETCAPCHARRSTIAEGRMAGQPLLDTHRPALLDTGLYEADGQMSEEVYEYGSFIQSPMYAAGVRCGDCHDPHSLALRAEGNAVCAQCHQPEVFDRPEHHRHAAGSAGAECAACHMPARTYMQIDARRDHSFRVPRPDLSVAIGTPNACTDCHAGKSARWAADTVARWFPGGRTGAPHFALALDAGRRAAPGAAAALAALAADSAQPAIVRATALTLLPRAAGPSPEPIVRAALADREPLVRLGAVDAVSALPPEDRAAAVPLLRDPLRAIRIAAAEALVDAASPDWGPGALAALGDALEEYRAAQRVNAERPESHVSLGSLAARRGELDDARREYETALRVGPWFVPAYVNLADLERAVGRDAEAEALLRRALAIAPDVAETHYALGLALVRQDRRAEALSELVRAAELAADVPRFAFVAALLQRESGDAAGAAKRLDRLLERFPDDAEARALRAEIGKP